MLIASIREEDCIGCAKCLPACPVDAILGAAKFLHTVLYDECIGCQLCIAPCPMNCIEMIETSVNKSTTNSADINDSNTSVIKDANDKNDRVARASKAKQRYIARRQRLIQKQKPQLMDTHSNPELKEKIRQEIEFAIARVKAKKNEQQTNSRNL